MRILKRNRLEFEHIAVAAEASFFTRTVNAANVPFFWHHHPEIEISLIVSGRGQRYVGDSIEDFTDGDLCILGGGLPHCWNCVGRVKALVIQFAPDFLGGILRGAPELRPIKLLLERAGRGLHIGGVAGRALAKRIQVLHEHRAGSWQQLHELIGILGAISDCGGRALSLSAEHVQLSPQANRRINDVFTLIHQRDQEVPSQARAAAAVKMSPQSFSRLFKRCVGKTYNAYVSEYRINTACRQLMDSDKPIIDIAYGAGFGNLSNFNRRFRQLKRMTPSKFRSAHRRSS
jgi:AraC-like DNA-binding protein/mannose-6-phosphate isomerase-like protein (cupin superfamily)